MNKPLNKMRAWAIVGILPVLLGVRLGFASQQSGLNGIDFYGGDCKEEAATMCTECRKLFDSDVPFPFQDLNTRVELRDGELYKLVGELEKMDGQLVLKVDPVVHPWLTNRLAPVGRIYPILSSSVSLKKFIGKPVQVVAQAVGRISLSKEDSRTGYYIVYLKVFAEVSGGGQSGPGR